MGGLLSGVSLGAVVSVVGLAALSLSFPLPPRDGDDAVAEALEVAPEVAAPQAEAAEEIALEEATEGAVEEAAIEEAALDEAVEEADAALSTDPEGASTPATEIPLPSGSEFNRPPPEPEAAVPAPDEAPAASAPQAPALAGQLSTPSFDTTTAAQPAVASDAPTPIEIAAGEGAALASPAATVAPSVADSPTALAQPEASETPQVRTALLPQVTPAPEVDAEAEDLTEELVAAEPEAVPLQTPVFPTIGEEAEPEAPEVPADPAVEAEEEIATAADPAPLSTPAFPQTSGLPQVSATEPEEEDVVEEVAEEAPVLVGDLPAIQAFAAPFDAAEERPLMAIVLIDEPDSRIEISTLTRFSFPVAFAVDPLHPEAAARAEAYRAAGFEVVILGSMIADGATASDTEVAFAAAQVSLPEAVAVIDTPEGRIQGDRPVLDAVVAALGESGHGLLAFPRGLNAAEQSAARAGVPGATVFRFLDDEDQRATVITRFLARAAFAAAQEGEVIVVGRTRPDTVTALFSWALGGRSEAVALAPLSATLLRGSTE